MVDEAQVSPEAPGDSADGGASEATRGRIPHVTIAALGLVTIAAYGSAFYAFGVLLGPILDDTGWSEAVVAGSFSASTLIGAFGAAVAGRLVDAVGARVVMLAGGLLGCAALALASVSPHLIGFAAGYAVGGGLVSATGFYHVTQAAAARASTADPARGIMLLTLYGAFAGPIYLPVTGFLVEATDWHVTLAALAAASAVGFVIAALAVPKGERATPEGGRPPTSVRTAMRDPRARALLASQLIGGIGLSTLMVYQVPLMVAAGLSLTTAASVAGVRGFAQFGGRAAIIPIVPRVGARVVLTASYLMMGGSALLLAVSGNLAVALIYVVIAGVGVGIWSPIAAVYAQEIFPPERVATLLGTQRMVGGLGGALGPLVAGVVAESTGSRAPTIVIILVGAVAGAVILEVGARRARASLAPRAQPTSGG
jgi:MFS family permease